MSKHHNSNNDERRNYYRILNVQPDASLEIIKNNYRTLLQKLRLHPDLGGKNWNASIINEAYNTLRKPKKRAEYDKELLQRYDLKSLARGNLDNNSNQQESYKFNTKDKHGNQRNFYCLFNIQAGSPAHIIKTSYLTLTKDPNTPKELLNLAYTILSNTEKRALYDKLLSKHSHAYALKKITTNLIKQVNLDSLTKATEKNNSPESGVVSLKQSKLNTEHGNSKLTGSISDISPTGMQIVSNKELVEDQIIKLDGEDFKAVGIVSYSKKNDSDGQQIKWHSFLNRQLQ